MPNWCNNTLTVSGDSKLISEFHEQLTTPWIDKDRNLHEEVRLCTRFLPLEYEADPKWRENGKTEDGWYDAALEQWGTKWGDCDTYIADVSDDSITLLYDTAWSPMEEGIVRLSELFKGLTFENYFNEPGMGFRGRLVALNGEMVESEVKEDSYGVPDEADEYWEEVMDEFYDTFDPYDLSQDPQTIMNEVAAEIVASHTEPTLDISSKV